MLAQENEMEAYSFVATVGNSKIWIHKTFYYSLDFFCQCGAGASAVYGAHFD